MAAWSSSARQATLLNPEFWVAYYQLAQAYERLGQYDAALDALQKARISFTYFSFDEIITV